MKRVLLLLHLLIGGYAIANSACITAPSLDRPNASPITFRDITTPDNPSVQRLVQAYLDFDMEEIVVQFNTSVGNEVTVTITSLTGATVSMVMCDSDLESLVSLPIPPKGAYILRVESATYQGEGTFTVQ